MSRVKSKILLYGNSSAGTMKYPLQLHIFLSLSLSYFLLFFRARAALSMFLVFFFFAVDACTQKNMKLVTSEN
jgi:hypothetical protein